MELWCERRKNYDPVKNWWLQTRVTFAISLVTILITSLFLLIFSAVSNISSTLGGLLTAQFQQQEWKTLLEVVESVGLS